MSALTERIQSRVEPELKEALERQAQAEGRDLAQLVRVLLRAAMVLAGQLERAASDV